MSPTAALDHIVSLSWCFQISRQCEQPTEFPDVYSIARNSPPDQLIAPPADWSPPMRMSRRPSPLTSYSAGDDQTVSSTLSLMISWQSRSIACTCRSKPPKTMSAKPSPLMSPMDGDEYTPSAYTSGCGLPVQLLKSSSALKTQCRAPSESNTPT